MGVIPLPCEQKRIYSAHDKVGKLGDTLDDPHFKEIGVIAQEVLQIPQLAHVVAPPVDPDEPYAVSYTEIFSYNVRATQELHARVKALEERLTAAGL